MTTERHAWSSLHPLQTPTNRPWDTCPCGQELDCCARRHCPRCGTAIAVRAGA
jgi:hypothetical protein